MIKYFTKLLGIDKMPQWILIHLLVFSLALGGIQAILYIVAISGFISGRLFDYYPEAIALSGLLGILLYGFLKYAKQNFSYRKALLFYFVVIAFIVFLSIFLPVIVPIMSSQLLLFIIFIPISFVNQIVVIEICNNISFQKYQQNLKRYTEALYLAGSAIFSLGIVIALKLGIGQVIFIPIIFLLGVVAFESNYILKKVELKKDKTEEEPIDSVITLFSDLPFKLALLIIFGFILLSVLNYVIINYLFIEKLAQAYNSIHSITMFLGMFFAGLMTITLLFKTFVYQNLIKTFRINKALLVSSVFMICVMVALNIVFIFPGNSSWSFLTGNIFIVIVFANFFNFLLRESFELYSLRMIFSTISFYAQKAISNNLHVLFVKWGFLFSGLILLLIMSFDLFTIKFLVYANSIFVGVWLIVSFWLIKKYGFILIKIIDNLSTHLQNNGTRKSLKERVMLTTNLSGLKYLLNYQRYYQPFDFQKNIEEIPATMQDKLGFSEQVFNPSDYSTKLHEPSKFQKGDANSLNYYDSDVSLKLTDIESLASSTKIKDRIRAVKMIENSNNFAYAGVYKMLIRDTDDEVRRNALLAAVRYYNSDILAEIVKYINHEEFSTLISEVFIRIGDDVIPMLTLLFNRIDTDIKVQILIIKIMGRIATPAATNFLTEMLLYPNKWVVKETVASFGEIKPKSNFSSHPNVEQAIFKAIGTLAWLLAKEVSIDKIRKSEPLVKALDDEYNFSMHLLFDLLKLKYQNGVIGYINENLETPKNNEQLEIQVELLGKIVSEEIKVRLFALLHNNQKAEKVEQLKQFFPVQKTALELAIKELVNADHETISTWTKACALKYYIGIVKDIESQEILAHIFNPDLIIAELVLFSIYKTKPEIIENISERIPNKLKNRFFSVVKKGVNCEYSLLFNKVLSIQKISFFQNIMGHYLIPFAECLHEIYLHNGETTYLKCTDEEILPVFFTPLGDISLLDVQKRQMRLNKNYLYGLGLHAGGINVSSFSDSVLFVAQPEQIGYLVIHFEELSEALFKYTQHSNFY